MVMSSVTPITIIPESPPKPTATIPKGEGPMEDLIKGIRDLKLKMLGLKKEDNHPCRLKYNSLNARRGLHTDVYGVMTLNMQKKNVRAINKPLEIKLSFSKTEEFTSLKLVFH